MQKLIKKLAKKTLLPLSPELRSSKMDDHEFVKMAYRVILERNVDDRGLKNWLEQFNRGLDRHEFVKMLISSQEFSQKVIGTYPSDFWNAIHQVRCEVIRTLLPPATTILDIGGANPGDHRGALLSFGYPHSPDNLYIVDLPPQERIIPTAEVAKKFNDHGCEIEYVYTSMSDLSQFQPESFDLVWSGESIEHITLEEAHQVFSQVHKLLKPNGVFALDTPNRRVTQLQCPYGYIHPEHKIEYYFDEFTDVLERHRFQVIQTKGLIEMSRSIQESRFRLDEVEENLSLNDCPEKSYLFYVACVKSDRLE